VEKIYREIKILMTLHGGKNIVKLCDVTRDEASQTPCLVYEYVPHVESKVLFPKFNDYEVRLYMFKLLQALAFSHSKGIMHRDVKPLNIIVDPRTKTLRLIDWGLADFYFPG
jgi:casein kinase II subunit alpha